MIDKSTDLLANDYGMKDDDKNIKCNGRARESRIKLSGQIPELVEAFPRRRSKQLQNMTSRYKISCTPLDATMVS